MLELGLAIVFLAATIPFASLGHFYVNFGVYECVLVGYGQKRAKNGLIRLLVHAYDFKWIMVQPPKSKVAVWGYTRIVHQIPSRQEVNERFRNQNATKCK